MLDARYFIRREIPGFEEAPPVSRHDYTGEENGCCAACWAAAAQTYGTEAETAVTPATVVAVLGLEREPGPTRCGHPGPAWTRYLPGLCSLTAYRDPPTPAQVRADVGNAYAAGNPILACYEGEALGTAQEFQAEGGPIFRPIRLVWAVEDGADAE